MKKYKDFGKQGRDKVTGFVGLITAVTYYMYGCAQVYLNPPIDKEGKKQEGGWFDEGRIEIISEGINPDSVQGEENGCEYREHPNT
jgi:hypothetical protein